MIGFFNDKMEFGSRALGNRSILANPCSDKIQDIINSKIKKREMFRPFAPAILLEKKMIGLIILYQILICPQLKA